MVSRYAIWPAALCLNPANTDKIRKFLEETKEREEEQFLRFFARLLFFRMLKRKKLKKEVITRPKNGRSIIFFGGSLV